MRQPIYERRKICRRIKIVLKMASFDECVSFSLRNCPLFAQDFHLKEKQLETLQALHDGRDCISVLSTGYGKSVIFQLLPWFAQRKYNKDKPMCALIVSPLNSLMVDQVMTLRKSGIKACYLNVTGTHGITYKESTSNVHEESGDETTEATLECDVPFDQLLKGDYHLIYSHPEALIKSRFSRLLRTNVYQENVCAVVIDEVHMVAEWGDEFRPAFRKLDELICVFEKSFHLLLTATATVDSINTLTRQMNLKNPVVISHNVDRPNIYLEIRQRLPNIKKFEKYDDLILPISSELKEKTSSFPVTIMYCENLEAMGYFFQYVSHELQDNAYVGEKIPHNRIFGQYHKDYPETMKEVIIKELTKQDPKIRLVFATVALGMGLNAPSVERVIHCRPPTTLEKYLQEIGRAGRQGQQSTAIMYYNQNDIAKNRKGMTEPMIKYCKTQDSCLRLLLVNYFGFESCIYSGEKETCCSNCSSLRRDSD